MYSDEQFEQLMLQYNQLKNGALDIAKMIENEDYDSAITMVKTRQSVFLNCKCMRNYLELTPEQKKQADELFEEIKALEKKNLDTMQSSMKEVEKELKKAQKTEKIQQAYSQDNEDQMGNIVNFKE